MDKIIVFRLFNILLENFSGKIDICVKMCVHQILIHFKKYETTDAMSMSLKNALYQTLAMCFHYNAALTFEATEETKSTEGLF